MAALTPKEKKERKSLYDLSYEYLRTNFSKFKEPTKIRIAISMLQIFERDDSKTKHEFHTHFTVVLDAEKSQSQSDAETIRGVQTVDLA